MGQVKFSTTEEYDTIYDAKVLNGKLVFTATKEGKFITVYDGKDIDEDYDLVDNPISFNGKLAYVASRNGKQFVASKNGDHIVLFKKKVRKKYKKISLEYDQISWLTAVGSKIAFIAREGDKWFVVYDDKKILEADQKNSVGNLVSLNNNKIAFTFTKFKKSFFSLLFKTDSKVVVYDGNKLKEYDDAMMPISVNGKLAFYSGGGVFFDDKIIGKEYGGIWYKADVNGKLLFTAKKDGKGVIVYDGKEIGKEYDGVFVENMAGSIIAFAKMDGKEKRVEIDTKGFDPIISSVKGQIVFIAFKNGKTIIVQNDKEIGKEYDAVYSPIGIGNNLAFIAEKDDKRFIVYKGCEIGKEYDFVFSLLNVSGKLAFIAKKDNKSFIVVVN